MKVSTFIERPVLSAVISITIMVAGIIGLFTLPVEQYPDIAPPTVMVSTTYFGANAETMQKSVVAPLEEAINGVEDMTYMTSTATNSGTATITIYFQQGTDPDMAAVNVQNRVSKATGQLPAEVTQVGVTTSKRQTSMLQIFSLYSPDGAQSSSVASSSSDAQSSSQATTQAQTATQQSSQTAQSQTASSQTTQAQSQTQQSSSQQPAQTSGFCLNGHSYPIRSFSGTGSVPVDGNVYAWTSLPNYYLFEMMGAAHSQLGSLHVGSEVVINGRVLHVSEIMYGVKNDGTGLEVVSNKLAQHSAGWQTCEQACYNSTLTVWFAD